MCGGSSKFKEAGGLGCWSLRLCTQEDPVLIESIVSQNVDQRVAASEFHKACSKCVFPDFPDKNFKRLGIGNLHLKKASQSDSSVR